MPLFLDFKGTWPLANWAFAFAVAPKFFYVKPHGPRNRESLSSYPSRPSHPPSLSLQLLLPTPFLTLCIMYEYCPKGRSLTLTNGMRSLVHSSLRIPPSPPRNSLSLPRFLCLSLARSRFGWILIGPLNWRATEPGTANYDKSFAGFMNEPAGRGIYNGPGGFP